MLLRVGENIVLPQWCTGLAVTLLLMQLGFMGGWASPTLARLTSPDSSIPLTLEEASWVASLVNIGRFVGAVSGAVAATYVGAKKSIFIGLFPLSIGWLIIGLANAVEWLYASRLFSGVALGMIYGIFPVYIGEVSMPEIRGALVSLATFGIPTGQMISSVASTYLDISFGASIYLGLSLILMGMFFWLPESPHHLIKIGDKEAAKKSISWYRAGRGVEKELDAVEKFVASNISCSFKEKIQEFKSPPIRRATFQVMALYTFAQISGLNSVLFYMEIIMNRAKFNLFDPALVFIFVNISGTFAALLSIVLIDRCGRRFLLLLSSCGITISMVGLMTHFFLIDSNIDVTNVQWLPVSAMFLFVIAFFIGLMPVPSAVLSEIFPANIKCIAACIAGLVAAITSFLSAKTYQPMVDLMGETYVFLIYAICSLIVIPYTIFIMPETKGKSLQQIQDELMNK